MRAKTHIAKAGDLICGRIGGVGDWMILAVTAVDADGFVALVADQEGATIAVHRMFGDGLDPASPHMIIPAESLTAEGRAEAIGLCAKLLCDLKPSLRAWKAVTLQ